MATLKADDQQAFPYPGIPGTGDGSDAIAYVETRATDGAAAYPITSSTIMGQNYQVAVANGFKNVWGNELAWLELESEHSSASACEGYALAGGRVTNFTSGQGLILMKEVLYTIAGKRLPQVLNVAARALTHQGLNVHAGHDDVMGVADCNWGILFAQSVQASADLCMIARRASENALTPMMNVQDGFLISHTIENLNYPEDDLIREYLGNPRERIRNMFDPEAPLQTGVVQNQDAYMQGKVAQRAYYDELAGHIEEAMAEFYRLTGRKYGLVDAVSMEDADYAIIAMGTTAETAMSTIQLARSKGIKLGVVNVTCYRPFPAIQLVQAIKNCKAVAVIERCDVPTMVDNPLTTDIEASLAKAAMGIEGFDALTTMPYVFSGTAGLGSRDVTPGHMLAVVTNMQKGKEGKRFFSLGIEHETALHPEEEPDVRPQGSFSVRAHSVGGFGSVTTNKVIATMLGDIFGFRVQAAPKYGSEKKGLPTNTYLTVTPTGKILTHCELQQVDFVPLMDPTTWFMGNPLVGLADGGIVFQHTDEPNAQALWDSLPPYAKYFMQSNKIKFYGVDTIDIARESCLSDPSLIQRFQGVVLLGVFLRVTPFQKNAGLSSEDLFAAVRKPLTKYFGKRGQKVVDDNLEAVKRGYDRVMEVTQAIMDATPADELAAGKEEWEAKGKDVNAFFI
ncbi:pyruvate flavodoxin/ferredoxin oxidoreductase domain protein [Magnetococcus marinus MC-1]|uniref:Pyruvate flavodoxin/ferredoxin oxidoreductase domain protein n=1 Tax=Magnetococcus marinus (strain ATCC BAA-1437 / JCM 17883 / MC-1) TaxID=156889 RepID=A0L8F6_MAGMM|nr:2-oxoacid:acceptor oxidoreductase family protein [Magnetococcus marinus]ABK44249.1 pyruvate flavodoxin/ferredoxin oxidoreductase domain protein [Magnetococcus marinus MC-1]